MLTVAAEGHLEKLYFQRLCSLWVDETIWSLITHARRTIAFNTLCFRVLAKQGALIHYNIAAPHEDCPYCLFGLLKNDEACYQNLQAKKHCQMDPWSASLLQCFPDLRCQELQVLEAHAILGSTHIAQVEARHASIRKQLVLASTQTWSQEVTQMSSAWMLQQLRRSRVFHGTCKNSSWMTKQQTAKPVKVNMYPNQLRTQSCKRNTFEMLSVFNVVVLIIFHVLGRSFVSLLLVSALLLLDGFAKCDVPLCNKMVHINYEKMELDF
eukprot:4017824-Amphidinium_carterae.2